MNATGFSVTVDALETLKIVGIAYGAVSYTHLDVYKRQEHLLPERGTL